MTMTLVLKTLVMNVKDVNILQFLMMMTMPVLMIIVAQLTVFPTHPNQFLIITLVKLSPVTLAKDSTLLLLSAMIIMLALLTGAIAKKDVNILT
jgi:hypothetical protein